MGTIGLTNLIGLRIRRDVKDLFRKNPAISTTEVIEIVKNLRANMISIVITIYNRENTIEAAIESCLIQDFSHYEIILVDDGSTDNSAHKVEKYLCNNVKYFYQEN